MTPREQVYKFIQNNPDSTAKSIEIALGLKDYEVRNSLFKLKQRGYLKAEGTNRYKYNVTDKLLKIEQQQAVSNEEALRRIRKASPKAYEALRRSA